VTAGPDAAHGARHLIGDVQRFGLLSAAAVVDRYVELVDRAIIDPLATGRPPDERDAAWLVDGAARMTEASLRLLDGVAGMMPGGGPGGGPGATAGDGAGGSDGLVLPPTPAGSSTQTSVWVHNPTSSPTAAVDVYVTSLVASNGYSVPVAAVSFLPARVDPVPPGGGREVRLHVDVPADQPPGLYHGLVLSSVTPDEAISVRLHVSAGESP
jgi:hypothetical protein